MFWKIRAEVTTKMITLDEYYIIKEWLKANKIKHKDQYSDPGDAWAFAVWIDVKNDGGIEHPHTFEFYKKRDAVLFKTRWG